MSEVKSEKVVEKKSLIAQLEEEGDVAADYLEALLDIADLDGDIDIDVENAQTPEKLIVTMISQKIV